jgi:hypothetical protein
VVEGTVEAVVELRTDCGGRLDVEGAPDVDESVVDDPPVEDPVVPGRTDAFGDVPPAHEVAAVDRLSMTITPQRRHVIALPLSPSNVNPNSNRQ